MGPILLIDGDRLTRQLMQRFLTKCGFEVTAIAEPVVPAGVDPRLVLVFSARPWAAGVTLCRELKRLPELAGVPVLVVTDVVTPAIVREVCLAGAADVLPRLVGLEDLLAAIRRHLCA